MLVGTSGRCKVKLIKPFDEWIKNDTSRTGIFHVQALGVKRYKMNIKYTRFATILNKAKRKNNFHQRFCGDRLLKRYYLSVV